MIIKDLIDVDVATIDCVQIDILTYTKELYEEYKTVYQKRKQPNKSGALKDLIPEKLWDKEIEYFHAWYDNDIFEPNTDIELVYTITLKEGEWKCK